MEKENDDTAVFGFWIYLMTDLVIFAVLFAAFAVLRTSTFGGPSGREIFEMPTVLKETLILLTSSFTCALGTLEIFRGRKKPALFWFAATFILGASFLTIEITEFFQLVNQGYSWRRSGFLSSYFTLVGTHGTHISVGLLWMFVAMLQIGLRQLTPAFISKIFRMALFWHFLDLVWIFIFTAVYGVGHLL